MLYNSSPKSIPLTSLGFVIGSYSVTCSLDQDQLRITTGLAHNAGISLNLTQFIQNSESVEITLQPLDLGPSSPSSSHHTQPVHSGQITLTDMQSKRQDSDNHQMVALSQQIGKLEEQIGQLLSETRPRRASLRSTEDGTETMKLQMLNELLQDKVVSKENEIRKLNQRINEQEQLIEQLAEKLIAADQDKQEMFNEYEKILNMNVYNRQEIEMRLSQMKSEKKIRRSSSPKRSTRKESESISEVISEGKKILDDPNEKEATQSQQGQTEEKEAELAKSVELPTNDKKGE